MGRRGYGESSGVFLGSASNICSTTLLLMGWSNGPRTWSELETRLSDGRRQIGAPRDSTRHGHGAPERTDHTPPKNDLPKDGPKNDLPEKPSWANGGDSPAWSRKRDAYQPPTNMGPRSATNVAYAELHCHSNFSFLDGASHPEALVEEAVRLGLEALAITDNDGLYGVVRFAEAARAHGLATIFGAELTIDATSRYDQRVGRAVPEGAGLVILAQDPVGYGRLARAVSTSHLAAGEKGAPRLTLEQLAELARGATAPFRTALRSAPAPEAAIAQREGLGEGLGGGLADVVSIHALTDGDEAAIDAAISRHPAAQGRHAKTAQPHATHDDVHWRVLTGTQRGALTQALMEHGPTAARRQLDRLVDAFGRECIVVELWDHGDPLDSARNDALARLALQADVDLIATNDVRYATPSQRPLATALSALRARRSLDDMDGWLPASAAAHLRSGAEQARRFARYPGVLERAVELGRMCAFDLQLVAPKLPPYPCPAGHNEMTWLRELTERGAIHRYGPRTQERVPGAYAQIDHELALIDQLGFPGYFLIVWDLVEFCRRSNIFAQGRGSAANSAACYALGITNADAVSLGLLFERFLSPERDGPPDIDIDIESGRREEVIQYVYARYGRENAAQVANVITYRSRSAIRDMGRALGHAPGRLDAWAKQVDPWGKVDATAALGHQDRDIPDAVLRLAAEVEDYPRHLGIHSGGMVLCDRPVVEVCPVEWGRFATDAEIGEALPDMRRPAAGTSSAGTPLRTVLQWDKEDCARAGLVKFDLLGLGMLSALHFGVDLIAAHHGVEVDLALIEQEDAVYEMLCRADTVGVFQIESRAQMATLPRLRPRRFYDLVVEIALIRPGPIQGGSVHPYIRRRNGLEPVTYLHPLLERSLAKTLGIPLFQEQLMQMSIDVAGFSGSEADQLRQAMGSKRSPQRMAMLRARFDEGCTANGVSVPVIDELWEKLAAFANYGFPESHSVSFAYLVYSSSWMKYHYPAAFCAALLNAQPMGFYSPQSLTADARRHGVTVHGPEVNRSAAAATLEWPQEGEEAPASVVHPGVDATIVQPAVRLGLSSVRHVGQVLAERIHTERSAHGQYVDIGDLVRRTDASTQALEALATAGALSGFGHDRRRALWAVGALAHDRPGRLAGIVTGAVAPSLPGMDAVETMAADLWATGVTPNGYPTELLRARLDELGVVTGAMLAQRPHGSRVRVAGIVTHRQRPATAGGVTFINLEDETGLINIICSKGLWARYRKVAQGAAALLIRGRLERTETITETVAMASGDGVGPRGSGTCVINIVADRIDALAMAVRPGPSRDFR